MEIIAKHDGKTQGDINDNEQFLDQLNSLKEDCICNVRIDEYYNNMIDVMVSKAGLREIYVYCSEEFPEEKKVDGYIYKISGLKELRKLLYEKKCTLDKDEIDEQIEALEVLFENCKK